MAILATGCSGAPNADDATSSSTAVVREAGKLPSLPVKIPTGPFDIIDMILGNQDFLGSLFSCMLGFGCFEKSEDPTQKVLRRISSQLTAVKAEVQAGIAATRVDLATGEYAAAQQAYDEKYGDHVEVAARYLERITDSSLTDAQREAAKRSFMREGALLVPATSASAVRGYLTALAGNGGTMSSGGLLGSAWNLVSAQERSAQGDASGDLPAFLPAKSANLMSALGTQRLLEGSQFILVTVAYELLRSPKRYEDPRAQQLLRRDLKALWINGTGSIPGVAAITAALPRELPNQSGVFTQGFGDDIAESGGLLVRNFGPTVDTGTRTGPIVSADAGYSLAPGLDEWLVVTGTPEKNARPSDYVGVRDLTLSRTHDAWGYDNASGSLATTVTATDFPELTGELGSLVATYPSAPKAGDAASFAKAGSAAAAAAATGWELDPANARIRARGATGLCLAVASRDVGSEKWQYESLRFGLRGYQSGYRKLAWAYRPTMSMYGGYLAIPPRLQLADCATDSLQQWFLEGPVPMDGLPFGSPAELLPLSGANVEAIETGYPIEAWSTLTGDDVTRIFALLKARSVDATSLFRRYGAPFTRGDERALPPILHLPLSWETDSDGYYLPPSELARNGTAYIRGNNGFAMTGVAFPVVGGKFAVRVLDAWKPPKSGGNSVDLPGMSTAAILGMRVETCTFSFLPPRGEEFPCAYKNDVRSQLTVPAVTLSAGSPLEQLPSETPDEGDLASASPSGLASGSPSPSSSDDATASPSPTPTKAPSPTPSPSTDKPSREPTDEASPSPTTNETDGAP